VVAVEAVEDVDLWELNASSRIYIRTMVFVDNWALIKSEFILIHVSRF